MDLDKVWSLIDIIQNDYDNLLPGDFKVQDIKYNFEIIRDNGKFRLCNF